MPIKTLYLRDYVAAFYERRLAFIICLVMTPVVALLVNVAMPKVYQASVKIWAKEQRARDPLEVESRRLSFLKDQQELLLSNRVAESVLDALGPGKPETSAGVRGQGPDPTQRAKDIAKLKKRIEIDIDVGTNEGGSSFIGLKVTAPDPAEAARTANL